jgi:hypothetical protein
MAHLLELHWFSKTNTLAGLVSSPPIVLCWSWLFPLLSIRFEYSPGCFMSCGWLASWKAILHVLHLVDQQTLDPNWIVPDIQEEEKEHQSLHRKISTEGFKNGLDWIHFTFICVNILNDFQ